MLHSFPRQNNTVYTQSFEKFHLIYAHATKINKVQVYMNMILLITSRQIFCTHQKLHTQNFFRVQTVFSVLFPRLCIRTSHKNLNLKHDCSFSYENNRFRRQKRSLGFLSTELFRSLFVQFNT